MALVRRGAAQRKAKRLTGRMTDQDHSNPPQLPIYMDAHATTPCDRRVVEAMLPTMTHSFGNAASRTHRFGWEAEALVEQSRERVAALLGASPREVVFTSGATEANNLAILGLAAIYGAKGRHIITSPLEHPSVLEPIRKLEAEGFRVTYLPVGPEGRVRAEDVAAAIAPDTILVSIMFANNEIGVINPVAQIGRICKERGVFFHCDAVQALSSEAVEVERLGVDLVSLSAHKFYGPKGIGALYVRRRNPRVKLEPLALGGGQECGLRSGTLNVTGIVGLGAAAQLVQAEREADSSRLRVLRNRLLARLEAGVEGLGVNGSLDHRLPQNLNISIPGVKAEPILARLRDIALSTGAACSSSKGEPSHVLRALGQACGREDLPESSIRFGLHRFTTEAEVDYVAGKIITAVASERAGIAWEPR